MSIESTFSRKKPYPIQVSDPNGSQSQNRCMMDLKGCGQGRWTFIQLWVHRNQDRGRSAHICVTALYLGSSGEAVRKSALTASTFLHLARDSMVCKVAYRFRSRSNANSCRRACRRDVGYASASIRQNGTELAPAVADVSFDVHTLPLFCISAARWEVLLPGAAVASIVTVDFSAGGARMNAGKHEALSCSIILPSRYRGSSTNWESGGNSRRSGICSSLEKPFLNE